MENAKKKHTIQRKEIVLSGTKWIDQKGNPQETEEQVIQTDHELDKFQFIGMSFQGLIGWLTFV